MKHIREPQIILQASKSRLTPSLSWSLALLKSAGRKKLTHSQEKSRGGAVKTVGTQNTIVRRQWMFQRTFSKFHSVTIRAFSLLKVPNSIALSKLKIYEETLGV